MLFQPWILYCCSSERRKLVYLIFFLIIGAHELNQKRIFSWRIQADEIGMTVALLRNYRLGSCVRCTGWTDISGGEEAEKHIQIKPNALCSSRYQKPFIRSKVITLICSGVRITAAVRAPIHTIPHGAECTLPYMPRYSPRSFIFNAHK